MRSILPLKSKVKKCRSARATLARKYLSGHGIEIGALARPVPVPHAEVRYYDRLDEPELGALYPHQAEWLVPLDGICDIETLQSIEVGSLDFVVACKVIEYTGNVLAAFHAMRRVLKPGGIAFLSISDMRQTMDRHRPVTTLGQIAADYVHGPATDHFEQWLPFIEEGAGDDAAQRIELVVQHTQRTRQHVWTPTAWMELLTEVQRGLGFELCTWHVTQREILTVLRKC